jgi:alpha-1,2-mannosyltransferase
MEAKAPTAQPLASPGLVFSLLFAFAAAVNHIDDTDETYGYYEPIHYLLYGIGMQTWEYSPEYSIRSYAFLAPFATIGAVLRAAGFSKLHIFFGIRLFIGQVMAFSVSNIVKNVKVVFGADRCTYLTATLVCCPGLFFCSTALLPSAIACTLVMAGMASFMSDHHGYTVLCGCLAVLWTGWPFVGLIFLPLGLLILYKEYAGSGIRGIFSISVTGVFHLFLVSAVVFAIDTHYYGKM